MVMDYFELPRPDWYDSEGRIYKDRLIENFNAIEGKLQAIREADGADVTEIDWNNVELDDVNLESEDNKIVNLRSLISIMKLDKLPVECEVDGKTIKRLVYYYNNEKRTINNRTLSISNGKYVWFNPTDGTTTVCTAATVDSNITNHVDGYLLGVFSSGKLQVSKTTEICDYDVLPNLANMPVSVLPKDYWTGHNPYSKVRYARSGRVVANGYHGRHHHHGGRDAHTIYERTPNVGDSGKD